MTKTRTISLCLALWGSAAAQTTAPQAAPTQQAAPVVPQTPAPAPAASPAITDVPAGHWARAAVSLLVQRGIILGFPDGTFRGNNSLTRYEAASIFSRLIQGGVLNNLSSGLNPEELGILIRGMQELQAQGNTTAERVRDLTADIEGLQQRLADTERALSGVIAVAATRAEVDALSARSATQDQVTAGLATKADASTVTALQARIDVLEQEAKTRADEKAAAAASAAVTAVQPGQVETVSFRPDAPTKLAVGGGVEKPLGSGMGYNAVVDYRDAFAGLGLRATGMLSTAAQSYSAQVNVIKPFQVSGAEAVSPYLGVGAGLLVSPDVSTGQGTTDGFASVLGGVSYSFTDTMRLYAEADGRYYLSGNGTATGNAAGTSNRVGVNVRAGVLISF